MTSNQTIRLQLIELLLDEHHRCEYAVRTWELTEQQRRSIVALLGKPNYVVYMPAAAVHAADIAAEEAGLIILKEQAP